jgi:nucleoside-diphosphate-sugar epimerase
MKIFLTGGSGFIGKNFYKLALKKGHFIYATSRKKRKNRIKNMKWLKGNINFNWKKELSDSDILVHMASTGINKEYNEDKYNTNVFKSLELIKNCIRFKCKNWLIISTSSEYGIRLNDKNVKFSNHSNRIPSDDYGMSKAMFSDQCIKLAKKFGCKVRVLRIFPVYGKGENKKRLYPSLIKTATRGKNFFVKNPLEKRDFSNVNFVSQAIYDAMNFNKKKFKTFQIWHVAENKPQFIKNFVEKYWKIHKAKGKLIFNKRSKITFNHITTSNSVWK